MHSLNDEKDLLKLMSYRLGQPMVVSWNSSECKVTVCNQCLSPLTFESRPGEVYSIQHM